MKITEFGKDAQISIVNTVLAPAGGGVFMFFYNWYQNSKIQDKSRVRLNFTLITNGILSGAVSITASCNQVDPWAAIFIGAIGAYIYTRAVWLLEKMKIDDPLHAA